jgi:hypothetical protein
MHTQKHAKKTFSQFQEVLSLHNASSILTFAIIDAQGDSS